MERLCRQPEGQRVLGTPGLVTDGEVTAVEETGRAQGWISFGKWENAAKLISSLSWRGRPELCSALVGGEEQRFLEISRLPGMG